MEVTLTFDATSEPAKTEFESALKSALEDKNALKCTLALTCEWAEYSANFADPTLTVTFKLKQISNLADKTIVTNDKDKIEEVGTTISVTLPTKKRDASTFTVTLVASKVFAECVDGNVLFEGACTVCPMGYYKNRGIECEACDIGSYSDVAGLTPCTPCPNSGTTLATGSTKSGDCVAENTVCPVKKKDPNGNYNPPAQSKVAIDYTVTLTCKDGYGGKHLDNLSFPCNTDVYPVCYRKYRL